MIILTMRTDKPEAEIGLYDNNLQLAYEKWEAHRQLAETLHIKIRDILKTQDMGWSDIEAVLVFKGPGSFTGLRIGISVANALGYGNDIKVIGAEGDSWINIGISEVLEGKDSMPVAPFYGSDANITTPRK